MVACNPERWRFTFSRFKRQERGDCRIAGAGWSTCIWSLFPEGVPTRNAVLMPANHTPTFLQSFTSSSKVDRVFLTCNDHAHHRFLRPSKSRWNSVRLLAAKMKTVVLPRLIFIPGRHRELRWMKSCASFRPTHNTHAVLYQMYTNLHVNVSRKIIILQKNRFV